MILIFAAILPLLQYSLIVNRLQVAAKWQNCSKS